MPGTQFESSQPPQFAGVSAGSNADVRSLPLAEVAIASILATGLWALQTRSWRATELHMKTARFKSTSRASRIGGTPRPLGGHVGEARHSHAMRQPPRDG